MLEFPATARQLHVRQHDAGRVVQRAHGRADHPRQLFDAIARAALANEDKRPPHRMTVSAGLPVPRFDPGPSIVCRVGARAWIHGRRDDCRLVVQKRSARCYMAGHLWDRWSCRCQCGCQPSTCLFTSFFDPQREHAAPCTQLTRATTHMPTSRQQNAKQRKRFKWPDPRSPRSRALQSHGRQRAGKGQGTVSKHGTYASDGRHHVLAPDLRL